MADQYGHLPPVGADPNTGEVYDPNDRPVWEPRPRPFSTQGPYPPEQFNQPAEKRDPRNKKPFWKRAWVWVVLVISLLVVFAFVLAGMAANSIHDELSPVQSGQPTAASMPPLSQEQKDANIKASTAPKAPPAATVVPVPPKPSTPPLTVAQQNAVESAQSYIDSQGFSRLGLIEQLTGFEGYTKTDATIAVGRLHVDWRAQAVRVAQSYLDTQAFSRSGLITQLTQFEKFTRTQATYAADKVGL